MPVVDQLAQEYGSDVAFVAVAWKGSEEATASRAAEILPSGSVRWGLDAEEAIFDAYGVPYQPVTVLITHDKIVKASWPGLRDESAIRAEIEDLMATAP